MDRVALVTGGARRLGAEFTERLARMGIRTVLHYRDSETEAMALADRLNAEGLAVHVLRGDLADAGFVRTMIADAADLAGAPVSILVNNASLFEYDTPGAVDPELLASLMAVNLGAPVQLAAAFAAQCPQGQNNVVVNLLDQKLWNLNPDFFSYTCSKAALWAATEMMHMAFAPHVRAAAIAPGLLYPSYDQTEEEFRQVASLNLMQTPIPPEQVALALEYVVDSTSFSGQVLHVDNGQRYHKSDRDIMFSTRTRAT